MKDQLRATIDIGRLHDKQAENRLPEEIPSGGTRPIGPRSSISLPDDEEESAEHRAGIAPGALIGCYELIRELGRGGMGIVYLARDIKLGRRIAIKFMLYVDAEMSRRFLIEARATARCQHENIVVIHEVAEHENIPYMVLEYLEGATLEDRLAKTLRPERALEYLHPVARALEHAHELGIVHRDLKPENVFVTTNGLVKVLDFGIATALVESESAPEAGGGRAKRSSMSAVFVGANDEGKIIGTPRYMSPEQLRGKSVNQRTDIWAFGVILYSAIAGKHPLGELASRADLLDKTEEGTQRESPASSIPGIDTRLARVMDRCLEIDPAGRYENVAALLEDLLPLLPGRHGRSLGEGESPYPGLASFEEEDADRFFGREFDVRRMLTRLRERPIVAVVGPSGAGKSSFVRAGLVPALRDIGETLELVSTRPGRRPLHRLAEVTVDIAGMDFETLVEKMKTEPGALGAALRRRADELGGRVILFIDQFEELYTMGASQDEQRLYTSILLGVADDVDSPVRLILGMRSDFVDRAAEDEAFIGPVTSGLLFLAPLSRNQLLEAVTRPADMVGYKLESNRFAGRILDDLEGAASPLPLLQFAAATLWQERDREQHTLSEEAYEQMGGIAGALASHADRVLAEMTPSQRHTTRRLLLRLVTPDGTRAIVNHAELIGEEDDAMAIVIDQLAVARLLVVNTETEDAMVEIIHESLLDSWPMLRHWIDSERDDLSFLSELRNSAKHWQRRSRGEGFLWRGEALLDARRWHERDPERDLPEIEREFLDAVFSAADRSRRKRRMMLGGSFALLGMIAAGAVIALALIGNAEDSAKEEASRARQEAKRATRALAQVQEEERNRLLAETQTKAANAEADRASAAEEQASAAVATSRESLRQTNLRLEQAVEAARLERDRARELSKESAAKTKVAQEAEAKLRTQKKRLDALIVEQEAQVRALQKKLSTISTDL